jgi:LmbE family N-acetylglucosaminyl deacetylase
MAANEPGQPPLTTGEVSRDLAVPAVALAIGAHPDDVEFGCGATLAKWAAGGCVVHHLVLTDGSKGTWDPDADVVALAATRQAEQREAARRLAGEHAGRVVFLGQVDGELDSGLVLRGEVARVIREVRPDVVLGHDPWKRYRLHPDHRHAGFLVLDAVVAARDPHFFPEQGLAPHRPIRLLLFEADVVDHVETVPETFTAKADALLAHRSQWQSTLGIDAGAADAQRQRDAFVARLRDEAATAGARVGADVGEGFKRIDEV